MAVRACEACKRVRGGRRHGADASATSVAGKHERDASRHTQLLRRHTHLACLHLPCSAVDLATADQVSLKFFFEGKGKFARGEPLLVGQSAAATCAAAAHRRAHVSRCRAGVWSLAQRGLGGKALGMIKFLVLVNKQGQTRLARYYEEQSGVSLQERSAQVYARLCFERSGEHACVHPGQ